MKTTCPVCKIQFESSHHKQSYCSEICRKHQRSLQRKKSRQKSREKPIADNADWEELSLFFMPSYSAHSNTDWSQIVKKTKQLNMSYGMAAAKGLLD